MSSRYLIYPEIDSSTERLLYDELSGRTPQEARANSELAHPASTFVPNGVRVPPDHLRELRDSIRGLVGELGWPAECGREEAWAFRCRLPGLLHDQMEISPANAARAGVWSFLSMVLVPDVAVWRWPDLPAERVLGHAERAAVRNLLRIPWWRAEVLGTGPTDPPAVLSEDNLVGIIERPGLFTHRRVARETARLFIQHIESQSDGRSNEDLFREVCKRLLRLGAFTAFELLDDDRLGALIVEVIRDSVASREET